MSYRAPIELAPYSPQWNSLFAARRSVLASVFLRGPFRIEHTGRTAVTGLGAKPVIDVLIGGHSLAEFEARIPAAAALEYQCVPEHEAVLPQRRFFAKPVIHPRQFHVHAGATDGAFFIEHLVFRDSLRTDSRLAAEYFALKLELAARFGDDREGYADAKSAFIQSVTQHAYRRAACRLGANSAVGPDARPRLPACRRRAAAPSLVRSHRQRTVCRRFSQGARNEASRRNRWQLLQGERP